MRFCIRINPTELERRFFGNRCDYLRDGDGQIAVFEDFNEAVRVINFLNQLPVRRAWGYIVEEDVRHVLG